MAHYAKNTTSTTKFNLNAQELKHISDAIDRTEERIQDLFNQRKTIDKLIKTNAATKRTLKEELFKLKHKQNEFKAI